MSSHKEKTGKGKRVKRIYYINSTGRASRSARPFHNRFWISLVGAGLLTLATALAFVHYIGSGQYFANNGQLLEIKSSCGEDITRYCQLACRNPVYC